MTKIAILDDDAVILEVVAKLFDNNGYKAVPFSNGRHLIMGSRDEEFGLFILDWNVPDLSGMNVLSWIRNHIGSNVPVLMLTSRSDEEDIVAGLRAGADDFVTKPFQPTALLARIEALLRRASPTGHRSNEVFGRYDFNLATRLVTFDGRTVQLNAKEFSLALLLFNARNRTVTRTQIFESIWGVQADNSTRTLDVHISRIKTKLELRAEHGFRISNVYGYGYRLEEILWP